MYKLILKLMQLSWKKENHVKIIRATTKLPTKSPRNAQNRNNSVTSQTPWKLISQTLYEYSNLGIWAHNLLSVKLFAKFITDLVVTSFLYYQLFPVLGHI